MIAARIIQLSIIIYFIIRIRSTLILFLVSQLPEINRTDTNIITIITISKGVVITVHNRLNSGILNRELTIMPKMNEYIFSPLLLHMKGHLGQDNLVEGGGSGQTNQDSALQTQVKCSS